MINEGFRLIGKRHQYYFVGMAPLATWPREVRDKYPFGFYIKSIPSITKT